MTVDRLRNVAEAVENGESWYVAEDWGSKLIAEGPDDVNYIATFDPPTVLALLDVAECVREVASPAYREQPGPYAQGIRREDAVALTEAWHRLAGALGRLGGDTP